MRWAGLCIILLSTIVSFSQENLLKIPVEIHTGFGAFYDGFFYVDWNTDITEKADLYRETYPVLKGIPAGLKKIKRALIIFDYGQFFYQNHHAGKISDDQLLKLTGGKKWKEGLFSEKEIKCYVNLIAGEDNKGKQVYILDRNNNLDLRDDGWFDPISGKSSKKDLLQHISRIPIERKSGNGIVNDTASVLIDLNGGNLCFTMAEYASAATNINGKKYKLIANSNIFLETSYRKTQMAIWADSMVTKKVNDDFLITDSGFVFLDTQLYRYSGIDITQKELILEKVSPDKYFSGQVGFYAPVFSGNDALSGKLISLQAYKGKYVFIDFWGTWCSPCVAELPEIKKQFAKIKKDKFQMLSIATSDDLTNLKSFLKKKAIKWPQILSDEIASKYQIIAYPTNFLIDPQGKIIYKNIDVKNLADRIKELVDE